MGSISINIEVHQQRGPFAAASRAFNSQLGRLTFFYSVYRLFKSKTIYRYHHENCMHYWTDDVSNITETCNHKLFFPLITGLHKTMAEMDDLAFCLPEALLPTLPSEHQQAHSNVVKGQ